MTSVPPCRGPFLSVLLSLSGLLALVPPLPAAELPLRRIVLFNAGVGFFEHDGSIRDDQTINMTFDASEINDLLKSLVVQDSGKGRVSTVTYGSRDPVAKTLRTFAIDLAEPLTVADLLTQVRGSRIRVEADETLEGSVLGVEIRSRYVGEQLVRGEWLNLLTEQGIQSVRMDSVRSVKLEDPTLDAELRQALALIAQSRREEEKQISIQLRGQGERRVRIGYIREFPVWKTSYRLVLADETPPLLQGWAIVENTTDSDWEDVRLTLVSGRPISFVMELYEPLYVQRPQVMPQLYATVTPRLHSRGFAKPADFFGGMGGSPGGMSGGPGFGGGYGMGGMGGYAGDEYGAGGAAMADLADLATSVVPQVVAEDVGDLFHYDIDFPVSVTRNKSAMLPIVNQSVQGERLSIYNRTVHEKHPMSGLRLTNATDLHLMQGPITVFDGGAFAGDAQVRDLAPGAVGLISYAVDLETEVVVTVTERPRQLASIRIHQGLVRSTYQIVRTSQYLLDTESTQPKRLIIEQAIDDQFELQSRDALGESTRDLYRFEVTVKPKSTSLFKVQESKTKAEQEVLANTSDETITTYLAAAAVPESVKAVFRKLVDMRREQTRVTAELAEKSQQIRDITTWQARVRENMKVLDKTSELYQQYMENLAADEKKLENLYRESSELQLAKRRIDAEIDTFSRAAQAE